MTFADAYAAMAALARQHGDTVKLTASAWFLFEGQGPKGVEPEFCIYSSMLRQQLSASSMAEVVDKYREAITRPRDGTAPTAAGPLESIGNCEVTP